MKIEEQVLSIEQMKHLQELGVDTSDASLAWFMSPKTNQWKIKAKNNFTHELLLRLSPERYIPTYTTGDLFRKLPSSLKCDYLDSWIAIHSDGSDTLDRYKPFENVCFHLGYTNITMTFRIVCIYQGYGVPEWGGGKERVFIISLGERAE